MTEHYHSCCWLSIMYQRASPNVSSGTEDRSSMLATSCLGVSDDGGRVVERRGGREGREGAGGGVVPDCNKSIRGIPHHSNHKPQTVLWHTIVCYMYRHVMVHNIQVKI